MKHIRQRNALDCGLAVAAMLADSSYKDARQADPFPNKTIGLSLSDFCVVIKRLCKLDCRIIRPRSTSLSPLKLEGFGVGYWYGRSAVIIRQAGRKYGHWLAVEDGFVFDPELDAPVPIGRYDRRNWQLLRKLVLQ